MYILRKWSVRHSRGLEWFYRNFEKVMVMLHPLWRVIGYARLDKPIAFVEKQVKGLLFDCQMCGSCVLSSTGMSCPMNCPKQLRNGPCGGVRTDGNCEVKPNMRCVWVEAYQGSRNMRHGNQIMVVQTPLDKRIKGTSAWLRVARDAHHDAHDANAPKAHNAKAARQ